MKIECGCCQNKEKVVKLCSGLVCCDGCGAINLIESSKDYKLQEWLNFNFLEYLGAIFSVIETHPFNDLKATTQEEIIAGKFTDVDVEKLRNTMSDGFQNELSIRELAEEIEKNVAPKNLFRTKNGKLSLNKKGQKILQMSKQYRSVIIARTESTRMASLGVVEHFKNQGVQEVVWIASIGDRTCSICAGLDGRKFPIETAPTPPAHVSCRCTIINLLT